MNRQPELVVNLYKERGETPLQALTRLKRHEPAYASLPLTYAGRLDPLADGVLLVVAGEEIANKACYLALGKEYELEVLFGVATDSYDLLGMITAQEKVDVSTAERIIERAIQTLPSFIGKQEQPYPPFSSKPVNGKPLFMHARQGRLDNVALPTHSVEIFDITCLEQRLISAAQMQKIATDVVAVVKGDFRQTEIMASWKVFFNTTQSVFPILRLRIRSSGGTYMRVVAHELGRGIGVPSVAASITRISVGAHTLSESRRYPQFPLN